MIRNYFNALHKENKTRMNENAGYFGFMKNKLRLPWFDI